MSPRASTLAVAVCFAAGAASGACGPKRSTVTAPPPYTFEMGVGGFEVPDDGVEILYEDDVLGRIKPHAPIVSITLPGDVYLVDTKGRLRARVEGSCGKQDLPLRIPFTDRKEETQALRATSAKPVKLEVDNPTVVRVYYDNDSGPSSLLSIGSRAVHVTSGMSGATNVVLGSCATSRQILVGSTRIGDVPPQGGNDPAPPTTLVDMTGGHCYRRRVHQYNQDGTEKKAEPRAVKVAPPPPAKVAKGAPAASAFTAAPDPQADGVTFKGQRVYAVGALHDLFVPSPVSLVIVDDPKLLTRVELQRCDRGKIVPAPSPAASASASATTAKAAPPPVVRTPSKPRPPPAPKPPAPKPTTPKPTPAPGKPR